MKKINNIRIVVALALVVASAGYLGVSAAGFILSPGSVAASTAPYGTYSRIFLGQGDYVWNWDFNNREERQSNVDWGMRFLFDNNAEVDTVKDRLDGEGNDPAINPELGDWLGARQEAYMDDHQHDDDWDWDGDRGFKNINACNWNWGHMRVYATGSGDQNFNTSHGFYVVGTSHRDREGLLCFNRFRSYEADEDWWVDRMRDHLGSDTDFNWSVYDRGIEWDNGVTGIVPIHGNTHRYESDGWGVRVSIPSDD